MFIFMLFYISHNVTLFQYKIQRHLFILYINFAATNL